MRNRLVTFRVDSVELGRIDCAAANVKKRRSAYIRERLLT